MEVCFVDGLIFEKVRVYWELVIWYGCMFKVWEYCMQNIFYVLDQVGRFWLFGFFLVLNVGVKVELKLVKFFGFFGEMFMLVFGFIRELLEQEVKVVEVFGSYFLVDEVDERQCVLVVIVWCRGQFVFCKVLLDVYGGWCVMIGCDVVDVFEVVYICFYFGQLSSVVSNGFLLCVDVYIFFDFYFIVVDLVFLQVFLVFVLC